MTRARSFVVLAGLVFVAAGAWIVRLIPAGSASATPCAVCPSGAARPLPPPVPEEGHERQAPPRPGDWLDKVKEKGQTFEDYVARCANRVCPHRRVLYLQPLRSAPGRLDLGIHVQPHYAPTLERMREYAEVFFGVPARILEPIPMPEETLDADRDQYDAGALLDRLSRRVPADAVAVVALTKEDLFVDKLNYVFGLGSLAARTGVYSLRRFQHREPDVFLRRSLKLLAHEAGHIFSIEHCTAWSCLMQGANSLPEHDEHPLRLCPIDARKLEWNAGFDRAARDRALLEFYRRTGLAPEAEWLEKHGAR